MTWYDEEEDRRIAKIQDEEDRYIVEELTHQIYIHKLLDKMRALNEAQSALLHEIEVQIVKDILGDPMSIKCAACIKMMERILQKAGITI